MSALTLTLEQPTQVGDRSRSDSLLSTLRHVPGAVIRGALAAAWIAEHGVPDSRSRHRGEFLRLFEGGVRFGPLFSGPPVPSLAVLAHKYPAGPGCTDDDLDEVEHPGAPARCPDCGSPWEAAKDLPADPEVVVRRRASVVIGDRDVAERGGLFTRDTMSATRVDGEPVRLRGSLVASDPQLLQVLAQLRTVRIGGRRTTHGLATVQVDEAAAPEPPQLLSGGRVVLRLRSPGVFVDGEGRPAATPGEHHLKEFLGAGCRVERSWHRWYPVGGWHVASGLPKPVEPAVAAGSTYVVQPGRPVSAADLDRLARAGIGLRRHEGFGDVGGAPVLRPGRRARAEAQRRLDAPVHRARFVAQTRQGLDAVRGLLERHAAGDVAATQQLNRIADTSRDASAADDLRHLMAYRPDDVRAVLGGWS